MTWITVTVEMRIRETCYKKRWRKKPQPEEHSGLGVSVREAKPAYPHSLQGSSGPHWSLDTSCHTVGFKGWLGALKMFLPRSEQKCCKCLWLWGNLSCSMANFISHPEWSVQTVTGGLEGVSCSHKTTILIKGEHQQTGDKFAQYGKEIQHDLFLHHDFFSAQGRIRGERTTWKPFKEWKLHAGRGGGAGNLESSSRRPKCSVCWAKLLETGPRVELESAG